MTSISVNIPVPDLLLKVLGRTKFLSGSLTPVYPSNRGGWWPVTSEPFAGAWQRNIQRSLPDVLTNGTVFSCLTLTAGDIAKLWLDLVEEDEDRITSPTTNPAYSPVLRKPNHYQNRIQFFMYWVLSKLTRGNTYVLKERDDRKVVRRMYVLDPTRVKVLVAPDGSVFYELAIDHLSGITEERESLTVPASEIIHDLMYPLYHPLCGVPPISACLLSAIQGLNIQDQSSKAFADGLMLNGILTAPQPISEASAKTFEEHWNTHYAGDAGRGRVAVLGGGLTFVPFKPLTSVDAQLIEQLNWTREDICSVFHVPPYMVGVGPMPTYNNIQALNQQYYSQCLQILIESIEECLNLGLGLGAEFGNRFGAEFDLDALLRMDTATAVDTATKGITGGLFKPNEGRSKLNLKPVPGGNTPYLQQQQFSLEALNRRDQDQAPPPTDPLVPVKFVMTSREKEVVSADDEMNEQDAIIQWKAKELALGLAA